MTICGFCNFLFLLKAVLLQICTEFNQSMAYIKEGTEYITAILEKTSLWLLPFWCLSGTAVQLIDATELSKVLLLRIIFNKD